MEDKIYKVTYVGSYKNVTECPAYKMPEYCFIGRSNVGKSSMINLITGLNEMARTSRKPGKTQSINLFQVHDDVDRLAVGSCHGSFVFAGEVGGTGGDAKSGGKNRNEELGKQVNVHMQDLLRWRREVKDRGYARKQDV